jgi:hypothetical protein
VDKAGSSFIDTELSFSLDQISQSYNSWKRCGIAEIDTQVRRAMKTVVTSHGGTYGVDKAGSSFLVSECLYPLDQILQSDYS